MFGDAPRALGITQGRMSLWLGITQARRQGAPARWWMA